MHTPREYCKVTSNWGSMRTMTEQQSKFHNHIKSVHTTEDTVWVPECVDEKGKDPLIEKQYSFDQALELTGNGKFQKAALFVTGVSIMAVITEGYGMSFVLPAAKCEFQMSTAEQGFINSVGFLGVILASHFWGFMADTWGRRKVLRIALFLTFVMSLVSSLSLNSWMLVITRFSSGLSVAGVHGIVITYLGELMSNKNRPHYLAFLSSFLAIGNTLQPLLGLIVLTRSFKWSIFDGWLVYKPWRLFVLINSLIAGLGSFGMMLLPESPKFLLAMGKPSEALNILRKIYACNTGNPKDKYPVQSIAAPSVTGTSLSEVVGFKGVMLLVWKQTMPLFKPPYLINMLFMCGSIFTLLFVIHGQQSWYPQILTYYSKNIDIPITICEAIALGRSLELTDAKNTTKSLIRISSDSENCNVIIDPLVFNVSFTVALFVMVFNILLALLVNRFDTKLVLTWSLALNTISVIAVMWANQFYVNNGFMIILFSTNISVGILLGVYGDLIPTHLRAMALNSILMFGRLGTVLGINFSAAMIFRFCDTLYGINFLLMLLAVGISYFIVWKRAGAINL